MEIVVTLFGDSSSVEGRMFQPGSLLTLRISGGAEDLQAERFQDYVHDPAALVAVSRLLLHCV